MHIKYFITHCAFVGLCFTSGDVTAKEKLPLMIQEQGSFAAGENRHNARYV